MSLRLRLMLGFCLTVLLALLGLGVLLYLITAQNLQRSFHLELQTLARQYAQLALQADGVRLREAPPSPLSERLGQLGVFLFRADKTLQDALGSSPTPTLPVSTWQPLEGNQELVLAMGENRALAAFPIFSSSGNYRLAFALVLTADDVSGAQSLLQLRLLIFLWALFASVLALLLGYVLTGWLLYPLQQIAITAASVSSGQLSARIPQDERQDELGALKRNLNQMLVRLEHLVEAQRRFTANAAHDLRTPIAVLRTEIEVALRRPREVQAYREVLERLLERSKSLGGLTEDLLALARLEMGLEKRRVLNLPDVLAGTLETYQRAAQQKQLEFEIRFPAQLEMLGDNVALNRIFANLLANALRFAKTSFGIAGQIQHNNLCIRVWDDGDGVPQALRTQLFERFQKGTHSSGTGLGLAIADEATQAHNGKLSLEPSQVGAVFLVEFPCVANRAINSNPRLTQSEYNSGRGTR